MPKADRNIEDSFSLTAAAMVLMMSMWAVFEATGANWGHALIYLAVAVPFSLYLLWKRAQWNHFTEWMKRWREYL
jgi:hypothetical protein